MVGRPFICLKRAAGFEHWTTICFTDIILKFYLFIFNYSMPSYDILVSLLGIK